MNLSRLIVGLGFAVGALAMATAQSFNIDLDSPGPPELGGGAPSSAFGGAASQPGFWNAVYAGGPTTPVQLHGLDGLPTGVQLQATGGTGSYGGFNNPNLSGDFRLLMADGANVGTPIQYHFSGLQTGHYLLYTYSANASGQAVNLLVSVPGSSTPPQTVTGPMPPNQFIIGVDYCVHDLPFTGTSVEIDVSGSGPPNPEVHGFQIVAVPEPATVFAFASGLFALLGRARAPSQ
ncbi:MAG: hypothetical protein ACHQ50_02340 [Fimbriimonadales bacterium]